MAARSETNPGIGSGPYPSPRVDNDPNLSEWREAPITILDYPAGKVLKNDGSLDYRYPGGQRLIIKGFQVMDTCETPWAIETVNTAFGEVATRRDFETPIRILEVGFGLNIVANRVMQQFIGRGRGEYRAIELNRQVYARAEAWKRRWEESFHTTAKGTPGTKPDIKITLYLGDGGEVAEDLLRRGRKFDIIISDSFDPRYPGTNDLQSLATYKRLLVRDGIYMFFPFDPTEDESYEGRLVDKQTRLIRPHFRHQILKQVQIKPVPGYTYPNNSRYLIVGGLKDPIL